MATTYTLINSTTVGSGGVSSVTFSSIPNTYTDLVVKVSVRSSSSGQGYGLYCRFNNDSSGNYSWIWLRGVGSSAGSGGNTGSSLILTGLLDTNGDTSNTFSSHEIYIPNYTSSNYKSTTSDNVTENNGTTAFAYMVAGLWSATAAITSITLSPASDNFVQYSTFYLYGISNS